MCSRKGQVRTAGLSGDADGSAGLRRLRPVLPITELMLDDHHHDRAFQIGERRVFARQVLVGLKVPQGPAKHVDQGEVWVEDGDTVNLFLLRWRNRQ